jgi:hypothetical protein
MSKERLRTKVDDVTRLVPAGCHVNSRGSPDDEEAGCPARRTRGASTVADQGAGGPYGRHGPSLRTTSVSMGIEVEGPTKLHRDMAGRDGLGDGDAGYGARPAPVAFVHTMPIHALTIGGRR